MLTHANASRREFEREGAPRDKLRIDTVHCTSRWGGVKGDGFVARELKCYSDDWARLMSFPVVGHIMPHALSVVECLYNYWSVPTLKSTYISDLPVTKMTPRPSLVPESDGFDAVKAAAIAQQATAAAAAAAETAKQAASKAEPGKPPSRAGACRVCLKSFKPDDFSKTCYECQQRVCEDCASYSKLDATEDAVSLRGWSGRAIEDACVTVDCTKNIWHLKWKFNYEQHENFYHFIDTTSNINLYH